jgi:hypothetical protein
LTNGSFTRHILIHDNEAERGAGANRAEPLGLALGILVCSCQFSGRSAR